MDGNFSNLDILLDCLVHSLQSYDGKQELLVDIVLELVPKEKFAQNPFGLCITSRIFEKLGYNTDILHILHVHDKITIFISHVASFCEESGNQITTGKYYHY